jgi:lysophospholipase L1-like esterase
LGIVPYGRPFRHIQVTTVSLVPDSSPMQGVVLRYVALGDSYTIGTSVAAGQRFPERLVEALAGSPTTLRLVANLGVDGYTSADLIRDELPELERLAPDVVTVLIGVNDVVRRVPLGTYEDNAATILDALLARLPPRRIAVVGIPDYTVTPAGADHGDPAVQGAAIRAANMVMARLAAERSIEFIDIFDISREAATDRSLVAEDGLHPSGAQYAHWVERLAPVVRRLLAS